MHHERSKRAWLGGSASLAVDSVSPFGIGPAWQLDAGLWFGKHDPAYAIGKFSGVGVSVRQSWMRSSLVTEPMIELRRGMDIVVVSPVIYVAGGPQIRDGGVGATMLIGGSAKYRRTARFGITGHLELGASVFDGTWGFRGNLGFGVEWSSPWKRKE